MVDLGKGIPGYESIEPVEPEALEGTSDWTAEQWQEEFELSKARLRSFLLARDPLVVLARTAAHYILTYGNKAATTQVEQPEVEIVQAIILINGPASRPVPTSPSNFPRFWKTLRRHLHAFVRKQNLRDKPTAAEVISRRVRTQTVYYRNLFTRRDCEQTLLGILGRIDAQSRIVLGYPVSDLFRAMVRICDDVIDRHDRFHRRRNTLLETQSREIILKEVDFFRTAYPLADRVWRESCSQTQDIERLRYLAFQMSELAFPWIFSIGRPLLEKKFAAEIIAALYELSLAPGELQIDSEHIYLNNPIWKQPYVRDGDSLVVAVPQLVFSFPFSIIEQVIEGNRDLEVAYENARADYLEHAVAELLQSAMPNASVHRNLIWDDPKTGQRWENDIVAAIGNYIFVFEVKSGRISDVSRRGGDLSLVRNFKQLFVEPGMQGWRLQNYLDEHRSSATVREKVNNSIVDLNLDRPKIVFRFSICMEHFASLTSAKYWFKELGLVTDDTAWAPVLSLGELQMICRYLDSEVSLVHYLTRRATLESLFDFEGDEQDLLSLYLTNGLCIDAEALEGRRVMFHEADSLVRQNKIARADRAHFEIYGVQLSPLWNAIAAELYRADSQRHRFDIISVILNQLPPALAEFERRIRRFRRGVPHGGEDLLIVRYTIGKRTYVLAAYLAKKMPDAAEWREKGLGVAHMFLDEGSSVDCAAFIFCRRSKEVTFDGVSFYRLGVLPKPDAVAPEAH